MTEPNELPIKSLLKFYDVETIKDLKEVLLEEEAEDITEDIDNLDGLSLDDLSHFGL